ncbi:MAG TPA: hypothetical protein VKM55_22135 [Candidatus Lokiarchaeia archaeon]|nr:hypothetical protein [Candidatus Lokiarchaeia archaeon]
MIDGFTYYSGIGSRTTPQDIIERMIEIASSIWTKYHFILRSGHAKGADQAFELGCDKVKGDKEIYLPWSGFEGSASKYTRPIQEAYDIAKMYYSTIPDRPPWDGLKPGVRALIARDSHQVLGPQLTVLSSFVVCWTLDARFGGGTGYALRIAVDHSIPVFNLASCTDESIYEYCNNLLLKSRTTRISGALSITLRSN